ncbi:YihY/virulence factor BrkB family protein [Frankia sp. AgB1.9]|uniref:YihY/virulence factor BrkB family protein n=1 Tax=unclassified Frankia TaxID=2632575 RepID=UPI00193472A6|nr:MULTISPECIES: YihY/virulence factor BrkB family protein [unclassified Frankia]MBL7491277.1 YihY/virulence factor BrkB family protein [Frankia sp. AgW1.1]MBL7551300.1 YihY/virulence factor BrkB family protein [Frankia sp. AgB1.9]MBL7622264.1 YihY/virulence factor BrkB family protein [Frankia sp. AgB1.8]
MTTANERAPVVVPSPVRGAGSHETPPTEHRSTSVYRAASHPAGEPPGPSSARRRSSSNGRPGPDQRRSPAGDATPSDVAGPPNGGAAAAAGTAAPEADDGPADDGSGQAPAVSLVRRVVTATRLHATDAGRVAARAMSNAWRDRVLGLAAEAGFWQLLSLPPLLLALLGSIGYLGDALGSDAVNSIRNSLLRGADDLLTADVVDDVVRPTVDQILTHGRPDVISIGFVLSLWTGSTAMATFVNTITIAYGQRDLRSAVRSRIVALRLFIVQVITGIVLLPALVLGPGLLADLLRAKHHPTIELLLKSAFWPVVAVVALTVLTSLYHQALPQRRPWRRALPGAVFALVGWLVGSYLLRLYLERVFGNELVYGSLAAPAAALLFFYITGLAVLLGAELNAALDQRRPGAPTPEAPQDDCAAEETTPDPAPAASPDVGAEAARSQYVQDEPPDD